MNVTEFIALLQTFPQGATVVVSDGDTYDLVELCEGDVRPLELMRYDTPDGEVIEDYNGELEGMRGPFPGVYIA